MTGPAQGEVEAGTMDEAVTIVGRVEHRARVRINKPVADLLSEMKCHPEEVVIGSGTVKVEACLEEGCVIIEEGRHGTSPHFKNAMQPTLVIDHLLFDEKKGRRGLGEESIIAKRAGGPGET